MSGATRQQAATTPSVPSGTNRVTPESLVTPGTANSDPPNGPALVARGAGTIRPASSQSVNVARLPQLAAMNADTAFGASDQIPVTSNEQPPSEEGPEQLEERQCVARLESFQHTAKTLLAVNQKKDDEIKKLKRKLEHAESINKTLMERNSALTTRERELENRKRNFEARRKKFESTREDIQASEQALKDQVQDLREKNWILQHSEDCYASIAAASKMAERKAVNNVGVLRALLASLGQHITVPQLAELGVRDLDPIPEFEGPRYDWTRRPKEVAEIIEAHNARCFPPEPFPVTYRSPDRALVHKAREAHEHAKRRSSDDDDEDRPSKRQRRKERSSAPRELIGVRQTSTTFSANEAGHPPMGGPTRGRGNRNTTMVHSPTQPRQPQHLRPEQSAWGNSSPSLSREQERDRERDEADGYALRTDNRLNLTLDLTDAEQTAAQAAVRAMTAEREAAEARVEASEEQDRVGSIMRYLGSLSSKYDVARANVEDFIRQTNHAKSKRADAQEENSRLRGENENLRARVKVLEDETRARKVEEKVAEATAKRPSRKRKDPDVSMDSAPKGKKQRRELGL
ncbi:hypothetical protein LTR97_011509 [Elasticomyces elasticus]|uniref:Uncharacterized protein n=1 Tax=Elasticomyces elasticus TaxID=574655 RepID=A0AAN7W5C2_9PEZI|nr:hypothetical protein LTR97_011509 [Elasticomyces elasticus]